MSLQPQSRREVPRETARVARAVFPKGNVYMDLHDTFGSLYEDEDFISLYPNDGQPAISPVQLSLVLILQFAEGLSDRQAAEAVRSRIDWKYLLCLELTDTGFHYSVLSEFRTRLLAGDAEQLLFEKLLRHFKEKGLLKKRGQQRTDSTHILGAIRSLNRVELVGETMRQALNILAITVPEWMLLHSQPEWIEQYGARMSDYHLPKSEAKRVAYAEQIGADGLTLLTAIWTETDLNWLRELPAVQILWRVWLENYTWTDAGILRWRNTKELPPASIRIRSPYDCEARACKKRSTLWVGYKVHLTETCDEDAPRLITNVETTPAPVNDIRVTDTVHQNLAKKDCLPATHLVDSGYVDAESLFISQDTYEIDLLGPTREDTGWQSRLDNGFAARDFVIDWENRQATCPMGKRSIRWLPAKNTRGKQVIQIHFSKRACRTCHSQPLCTRSNPPRRGITIWPEAHYKALLAARAREKTETFSEQYAQRAGVEGVISQGIRTCGMRRSRYVGLTKTHLQHLLTAMAINLSRVAHWLAGNQPAQTRSSAFARLHAAAT